MAATFAQRATEGSGPSFQEHVSRQRIGEDARSLRDLEGDDLASEYSAVAEDEKNPPKVREAALLFSMAEEHLQDGEAEQSVQCATGALQLFREVNDAKGVQDTLRVQCSAYRLKEMPDHAMDQATAELKRFKDAKDKRGQACMLLSIAEVHHQNCKAEAALSSLTEAASLFSAVGDKKMEATALLAVVDAKMQKYDPIDEVLEQAKKALTLAQGAEDKVCEAKAWLSTATVHIEGGALVDGQQAAESAAELFDLGGNKKMQAAALELAVVALLEREQPRRASEVAEQALALCREIGYAKGQGSALRATVCTLLEKGDTAAAYNLAKDGLAEFGKIGDKPGMAAAQCALACVHFERHEIEEALGCEDKEVKLLEELGRTRDLASALLMQSSLMFYARRMQEALAPATQAKGIFAELKDKKGEGIATYAHIFPQLLDSTSTQEAMETVSDAQAIFKETKEKRWEARTLWAASIAHVLSGEVEDAVEKVNAAKAIFEEAGDKKGMAVSQIVAADVHLESKMYNEAIQSAESAMSICVASGHRKGQAYALQRMALSCLGTGEPTLAVRSLEKARKLCQGIEDKMGEVSMLIMLSNAHIMVAGAADRAVKESGNNESMSKEPRKMMAASKKGAFTSAKSAAAIAKFIGDKGQLATASFYLAQASVLCQRFPDALDAAMTAEATFEEIGETVGQAHSLITHAEVLMADKPDEEALEKAKELGEHALELSRQAQDADAEDRAIKVLQSIQAQSGKQAAGGPSEADLQMQLMQMQIAAGGGSAAVAEKKGLDPAWVSNIVNQTALGALATDEELHLDSPLMESGMDSLSSVAFRNALNQQLGLNMPAALMFDYPSQRAIIDHVVESSKA